jgi:quercetin dioxygenase-like cupin family protein
VVELIVKNINELGAEPAPLEVHGAPARAHALFTNGHLGGDLLVVEPNSRFPLHTHPGDHLLLIVAGDGGVHFDGRDIPTGPGDLYMVDGGVPHSVYSGPQGQLILSVGAPHKPVDSDERMTVVV